MLPRLPAPRSLDPVPRVDEPSARLQQLLVALGASLVGSGLPVSDVVRTLTRVAVSLGAPSAELLVFPNALIVAVPGQDETRIALGSSVAGEARFDRTAALLGLVDRASRAEIGVEDALAELERLERRPPRFPWWVRMTGHGLSAAAIAVLLHTSLGELAVALLLGTAVGGLKLLTRAGTISAVLLPVTSAFAVSVVVFFAAAHGWGQNPLVMLVPALISLLPGSTLAVAIIELAAGDMIAGASRMMSGLLQFALLAFGIVAGYAAVGLDSLQALIVAQSPIGAWSPWVAVLLFAVGNYFYFCGPPRCLPYLIAVLYVGYAGQVLGNEALGALFGGFLGAMLLTTTSSVVQVLPGAPPATVTFLPAFWVLAPGAAGLIGLTQSAGADLSPNVGLAAFAGTVLAIGLGVLAGTGVYRSLYRWAPARWRLRVP
ncbi:hypothetical protein GCM10011594_25850 [Nakamurella endophytica]|uniref:Threonine/serine exporter-like N-terminal domain-containing protein n=1 Tax=Nakamurella endophytica TaxID=1748367 RepID=A0A917WH26_9ACTN|nr:hypothetical protein GCM10011594_25850 [Nakamurella endophytica]